MKPTIIIWSLVIIAIIFISRVCNSTPQEDTDNPNRPYVAGCP